MQEDLGLSQAQRPELEQWRQGGSAETGCRWIRGQLRAGWNEGERDGINSVCGGDSGVYRKKRGLGWGWERRSSSHSLTDY